MNREWPTTKEQIEDLRRLKGMEVRHLEIRHASSLMVKEERDYVVKFIVKDYLVIADEKRFSEALQNHLENFFEES